MSDDALREVLDETAFRRLSQWRAYALRITRDPADAEEVVQEALARTLRAQPTLDSETRAHRYVLTAIRNRAMSLLRKRRPQVAFDNVEHRLPTASSALDVMLGQENKAAKRELGARLKRHLGELSPEHREVVELMIMRTPPLKQREVAAIQGIATNSVHYRLKKALALLLEKMEEEQTGDPIERRE